MACYPHGRGDRVHPRDIDARCLNKGFEVEGEHSCDPRVRMRTASDHCVESRYYYDGLPVMERILDVAEPLLAWWDRTRRKPRFDRKARR